MLTQRLALSEDKMFEVLNHIKDHDLSFVIYINIYLFRNHN